MRTRTFAIVAALLAIMLLGAGAVYAYDAGRSDRIAKGVSVGGVDVGGMRASDARLILRRALLEPLDRPVTVRHGKRRFTLTPARAKVGVDVDGAVDRALDATRSGGLLARTLREVRGDGVERAIDVPVSWSERGVRAVVKRVSAAVHRPARDATVDLSEGRIDRTPSRTGRRLQAKRLERDLTRSLLATDGARSVRARTSVVRPKVTAEELAEQYPAVLIVDRSAFKLTLYKNLEPAKTYGIAVGKAGLETPQGLYTIQNKAENPAWHVPDSDWAGDLAGKVIPGDDPTNPIKARWMGIYDGAGIHGTDAEDSIGTAASHGCIRMRIAEVKELYDQVPVESPVYIA